MRFFEKRPGIAVIIGILGISLSSIFVRYSSAPSAVTAFWRLFLTVLLMTPMTLLSADIRKAFKGTTRKDLLLSAVSGFFLAVHFVLWFESLKLTSVASSTTIVCTEVIWVALGFCIFLKGRIPIAAIGAILITLCGSVLIAFADSAAGSNLSGDILALLAAISAAVYMLIGREVRKRVSTSVYTHVVYIACSAVLLILCISGKTSPVQYGLSPVIVGFLLAGFSTMLGHSIFSWALKYFSPAFLSASKLCEPVAAAILAAILFGEIPHYLVVVGGLLILTGVFAYSMIESKKETKK